MGKFYGKVGYAVTIESDPINHPGVYTDQITERLYRGDTTRIVSRWQEGGDVNDDLRIANGISIVADAFAYQHFSSIKYVIVYGTKWKVVTVDVQRPRIILTLGGEYNG